MELFIEISGWIFGLISCVVAIIQTVEKNKYKSMLNQQKARAGKDSTITQQIGGNHNEKK